MIPCQKCGSENLLGAIFCRNCGVKLNLDDIRPNTLNQREESIKRNIGGICRRIISLVVLLGLIAVLVGSFMAVPMPANSLDTDARNAAIRKFQSSLNRNRLDRSLEFTSPEVTAIANYIFALDRKQDSSSSTAGSSQAATLEPMQIGIQILPSGYVYAVLKSRLLNKIDVYSTVVGRFDKADDGVNFTLLSAKAGKVPMKFGGEKVILGRFAVLLHEHNELENLRKRIAALSYKDGEVTINIASGR